VLTLSLRRRLIVLLITVSSCHFLPIFAQNSGDRKRALSPDDKLLQDLRQNLGRDRELLEKYFQKDFLNRIDGFFKSDFGAVDQDFDDIRKAFEQSFGGMGNGLNGEWKDTKVGKELTIDGAVVEGGNFDLKVKEGQVEIKGTLKKDLGKMGTRLMSFHQSFPVPKGTDANRVKLDSRKEGLVIIFPWLKKDGGNNINKKPGSPIGKDDDDITI